MMTSNAMDESNTELIFETWLFKLRGNVGEKRISHYLSGAWSKKYFVFVREGDKPKIFYYSKKPKDYFNSQKGVISLDQHYHVDQKPAEKGKAFIFQLSTSQRTVLFAVEKEEIYDLLMFFLRTQVRLKDGLESECFVVRPEKSDDQRRIGAQSAMCLLHVSQWGLTLALQLSKSVLAQWPLRYIRWYECSGRGRFAIETGSQASTGSGRYVFKTRVGQDSAIYDQIDTLVNEQAKMQGMVKSRVSSNCSGGGLEDYLSNYGGLNSVTEVVSDSRFISYLKKIARDIYDHLSEHLGGGRSGLVASWNSASSTTELLSSDRSCSVASTPVRSVPLPGTPSLSTVHNLSLSPTDEDTGLALPSQYLHMGTPVFDMSPSVDRPPSFNRSVHESVTSGSKVDYSLEQFIDAPEDSGSAEVYRSRRGAVGGSSRKPDDRGSSLNRLRLRSMSLDDLSEYVGSTERAISYSNSVFQDPNGDQEARDQDRGRPIESDINPYSYATSPDFGFFKSTKEKSSTVAEDNDGYCRPKIELLSRTLSDPNLTEENGVYRRSKQDDRQSRDGSRVRSIRHILIGQNALNPDVPLPTHSRIGDIGDGDRQSGSGVAAGPSPVLAKGVSVTSKTKVFTRQKSLGSQSPGATSFTTAPMSLTSVSPPRMLFHASSPSRRPDRVQDRLPPIPTENSDRVPRLPTLIRSTEDRDTSFV